MPTLNWIGKDKVISHHQDIPYRILEHKYGFTADPEKGTGKENKEATQSGNKIIHGDNLEALKSLLPEYEGKINVIYIDPPYNTGNESWVYNDNVNHPKIKKWLGEVVGKDGEDLTRHDKWLCMMYPRLKLLHKLLADDGAIFISIDDNEQAYLKLICDEIFGIRNFISNIAVVNNFKGRSDDKYVATAHENLIIYQKGAFITNGVSLPEEYTKEYKLQDSIGLFRLQGLRKRGSGAKREDRPNMYYSFFFNPDSKKISLEQQDKNDVEILPKLSDGSDGRWRWGKETASKRLDELTCQIVKTRNEYDVFQKDYLHKDGIEKRIKPKSFWHGTEYSAEAGTLELKNIFSKKVFETPKASSFIEYVIQQSSKDSIILDSFAGSGTTAHAVLNLNKQDGGNRKFILVEMEDYANDITAERVKRVANGYGSAKKKVEGTGGAFDYYELGLPLFDENENLNEAVETDKIQEYIWFSETRTSATFSNIHSKNSEKYLLGKKDDSVYYFIYEKEELTTLDFDALDLVKTKGEQYVIYADNCLLPKSFMAKNNIIFKKIPRDITRF